MGGFGQKRSEKISYTLHICPVTLSWIVTDFTNGQWEKALFIPQEMSGFQEKSILELAIITRRRESHLKDMPGTYTCILDSHKSEEIC